MKKKSLYKSVPVFIRIPERYKILADKRRALLCKNFSEYITIAIDAECERELNKVKHVERINL